jgi:signal transduction histidine kinase
LLTLLTEPFKAGAGSSGSGLGLAIVKDVVTSHHGRLTFGRGDVGFTAGFELPRRERPDLESA